MRSKAILIVLALSTALAVWAATPASKTKKTTGKSAVTKKTASKASTANVSKSKGKTTAGKKSSKPSSKQSSKQTAATRFRRSTQREPVPDRYKEIQQSLADKGYFRGSVNGAWGTDSVEALKRFQRDQNIGDDGKLGSLSLIALGLGPKRGLGEPGVSEKSENSEPVVPHP